MHRQTDKSNYVHMHGKKSVHAKGDMRNRTAYEQTIYKQKS